MMRLRDLRGRHALAAVWLAGVLDAAMPVAARDLGVLGETWRIAEADLLDRIEQQLVELERSGERARLDEEAKARARERLEAPEPVPGIQPARVSRTWLFDPAITVQENIVGPDGAVIAAAGTRIEPLAHRPPAGTAVHRRYPRSGDRVGAGAGFSDDDRAPGRAAVRSVAGPWARVLLRPDRRAHRAVRAQSHPDADPPGRAEAPNNRNPAGRERPRDPRSRKHFSRFHFQRRGGAMSLFRISVESRASCLHSCRTARHWARSAPGGSSIP